eukprot:TRINITY_DN71466_c0_g1_i1.p2 TRINITY_DN71466_c0_g1~~TRINITY_DN71466_c0_g1_i1.p2  ORF type:complete len:339 (+),score=20.81 TRINITY_DN71466_c0_g1_i1:576-1592(+)
MEKLMVCLKSKHTADEIPKMAAKVVYNLYSFDVLERITLEHQTVDLEMKHIGALVGLLEKKDESFIKEVLRIICNISNAEEGKKILAQCNVVPHLNKLLQNCSEPGIMKFAVACLANMATCVELKKSLGENGCLIYVLQAFQQGLESIDNDLTKYCLYFIGNICEDYPEAAYALGRLLIMQHMVRFLSSELSDELLTDALDVLYVLLRIKENLQLYSQLTYNRQYVKQEDIPEKLFTSLKALDSVEQRVKILELFEVLTFDLYFINRGLLHKGTLWAGFSIWTLSRIFSEFCRCRIAKNCQLLPSKLSQQYHSGKRYRILFLLKLQRRYRSFENTVEV